VLKKGSKTHSLLRQSNLQLQNEAALLLVEYEPSSIGVWLHRLAHTRFARSNLAKLHNRVANLSSPKKARPCPKKSRKSQIAGLRHIHIKHAQPVTTHKRDIKTRQKHRYNTSPISTSIFFPRNYTVVHLFFINNIDHF